MTAPLAPPDPLLPSARRITVTGIVQGVGFRPFVYALAHQHGLGGWVRNTPFGVEIILVGPAEAQARFMAAFPEAAPPLALLDQIDSVAIDLPGTPPPSLVSTVASPLFLIHPSAAPGDDLVPVSPDVALCADCLRELDDPTDRRYRYPFINCTNCGPRFTIITDLPYDRPATTMRDFVMCPACRAEYENPADRRFHAQPIACPVCGPQLSFRATGDAPDTRTVGDAALLAAQRRLAAGEILAVKGLGGYHLACDATNAAAVRQLRRRKGRAAKPLAVMVRDLPHATQIGEIDPQASRLLLDKTHAILLVDKRLPSPLADAVAPGSPTVGILLPYTPLHTLLLAPNPADPALVVSPMLVMTSANLSEEPIVYTDDAFTRLAPLVDGFLFHDRPIHIHCDDSVLRSTGDEVMPIRRARGLAPLPLRLPFDLDELLAVGAELKNTFCLTKQRYAFLSQHIGDMENLATQAAFTRVLAHYQTLFRIRPTALACDLHPAYLSTRWAEAYAAAHGLPLFHIQHHHAHLAALLAEHGLPLDTQAIGVIFDGTGYGTDGSIWGGEFLVGGYAQAVRVGRLRPIPLPGGDAAIRRPYRTALAHLWAADLPADPLLPPHLAAGATEMRLLTRQFTTGFNTTPTSSMGRLFDAVAALAGVRQIVDYEAQAAIELEALARHAFAHSGDTALAPYPLPLTTLTLVPPNVVDHPLHSPISALESKLDFELDARGLIRAIADDVTQGIHPATIAARFHLAVAAATSAACRRIAAATGLQTVALSGGVWQNSTLLALTCTRLRALGLEVLTHRRVPANDGGVALGQALVAQARLHGSA
jgi:hydrogenase maturation protein HypF